MKIQTFENILFKTLGLKALVYLVKKNWLIVALDLLQVLRSWQRDHVSVSQRGRESKPEAGPTASPAGQHHPLVQTGGSFLRGPQQRRAVHPLLGLCRAVRGRTPQERRNQKDLILSRDVGNQRQVDEEVITQAYFLSTTLEPVYTPRFRCIEFLRESWIIFWKTEFFRFPYLVKSSGAFSF